MELQQKTKTDTNGLIPPYGGELKNLIIKDKNLKNELISKATYEFECSERNACDVELLMVGAFSPLEGFMDENNYNSVIKNNRNTILSGKSLKIDSTFYKEQEIQNNLLLFKSKNKGDILHEGTVRSGERISSNGNLCIVGDVNPGAIVTAKKNIYVWGKLLGIAFAGKSGNKNASIESLYLNPLQLRIADVIAIGPKDKPKNFYPEIA